MALITSGFGFWPVCAAAMLAQPIAAQRRRLHGKRAHRQLKKQRCSPAHDLFCSSTGDARASIAFGRITTPEAPPPPRVSGGAKSRS